MLQSARLPHQGRQPPFCLPSSRLTLYLSSCYCLCDVPAGRLDRVRPDAVVSGGAAAERSVGRGRGRRRDLLHHPGSSHFNFPFRVKLNGFFLQAVVRGLRAIGLPSQNLLRPSSAIWVISNVSGALRVRCTA